MKRIAPLALMAALASCAAPALAQNRNCAERARVVERLSESYGESRQSIGLGSNNVVIEVFASLDTGTWTITATIPSGQTCLVASGHAFERLDETLDTAEPA